MSRSSLHGRHRFFAGTAWPDLIVGLAIAGINADAAREVWSAPRDEHRAVLD
jgi:hypothetical protein